MRGLHIITASGSGTDIAIRVANRVAFIGNSVVSREAVAILLRSLRRYRCRITRAG